MSEAAYYFGCVGQAGHFLHDTRLRHIWPEPTTPFGYLDGTLTPTATTTARLAALHHKDGWTALSMHDYSVDSRPGSHSTFVFHADLDFDGALAAATEHFPAIVSRIGKITPLDTPANVQREGSK
jgi:hypothetical protein